MRNNAVLLALIFVLNVNGVGFIAAQPADFFWSTQDLNQGAANWPIDVEYSVGDTGSLFLYYTTNGTSDSDMSTGFFLDIESSNPGVLQFTGAETFDFDITVGSIPIGKRLLDDFHGGGAAGPTGTVSDSLIEGLAAFTINGGPGILEANNGQGVFVDQGYDNGADAFLVARINYELIGEPGAMTEIRVGAGSGMIVNGGIGCTDDVMKPTFNCATIRIEDPVLCGVFAFGGCEIQPPPTGDMNYDGITNLLDVPLFVEALENGQYHHEGDINEDGSLNLMDVNQFIDLLVGDEPGETEVGDVNCDRRINLLDVPCFLEVLTGGSPPDGCKNADINGDGNVDLLDADPLIHILLEEN